VIDMGWYYNRYYKPSKPRAVKDGIKAKKQRGNFGDTWWSKRWISVLESFGWSNRLQRGRTYARKGQVIDLEIEKGSVISHVQGSQRKPYLVEINMKQISDKSWEEVTNAMAEQAIFTAKLLTGEMPENIEEAFETAQVNLFPWEDDLNTDCSCPDWANPCKHIAAVYYLMGERFDEDPFLIFLMRGRSKEELMDMLRKKRTADTQHEVKDPDAVSEISVLLGPDEPCELSDNFSFWELKKPIDDLRIEISPPEVELSSLKKLGSPSFWKSRKDFSDIFSSTYNSASQV
jgi:uncharacterized Zn finger protein